MRSVDQNTVKSIMTDRLSARSALTPPNFCLAPGFLRLVRHTPTRLPELPSTAPTSRSPFVQNSSSERCIYTDTVHSLGCTQMVHIVLLLLKRTELLFYFKVGPIPAGRGLCVRREGSGKSVNKRKGRHFLKIGCELRRD